MDNTISDEQIQLEIESGYKPIAFESNPLLPLSDLSDREFELLSYLLFQQEINESKHNGITSIALMQGIADRGRDCLLYSQNTVCGLIQCKNYKSRLTRPLVIKEIVKFLIYSTLDKSLLPDPKNFNYIIYVSNDFTEPATLLINSFKSEIDKEISDGYIDKYIDDIINEYEYLSCNKDNIDNNTIKTLLKEINISSSNASDLSFRIYSQNNLLSMFFNVKNVTDLDSADRLMRNALEDYGLSYLTDRDLKNIQSRIKDTPEGNRLNFGLVDFYGYNKEFFRFLNNEQFKDLMYNIINIKNILDKYLLDFVNSKIDELVFQKITKELLHKGKIHPFSVQIAKPYLFDRISAKILANTMPKKMLQDFYPQYFMNAEELIFKISQHLFGVSERILDGDYSQLEGTPDIVQRKVEIFKHLHKNLSTLDEIKSVFDTDIQLIRPVLDEIEDYINEFLQEERTVIIKDASFFDKESEFNTFKDSMNSFD